MKQTSSKQSRTPIRAAAFALAVGSLSLGVQAAPVEFFGVDLTGSAGGNLLVQPNSDAARNSFFSNLTGVGTETFESYTVGTVAPLALSFGSAGTANSPALEIWLVRLYLRQVPTSTASVTRSTGSQTPGTSK